MQLSRELSVVSGNAVGSRIVHGQGWLSFVLLVLTRLLSRAIWNDKEKDNQEMMGWKDPKITATMTCCELCTPHNIVDTGPTSDRRSFIGGLQIPFAAVGSYKPRFAPEGLSWPLHPFSPQIPLSFLLYFA
eukprot:scaffold15773_cov75-Cyclotella_meneghiniana.AAC.11